MATVVNPPHSIEGAIDRKIGEVRTDALDLSFGEIVSLHANKELIIQPEYQRLFRWSNRQRSRLIESILLELPIPQIFVIETENGVLELIDGLQRVCSVIQFIEHTSLGSEQQPLELDGCDLIPELNGKKFADLSLKLRLRLKRSSIRTIVIKRQSASFLRYEMFMRLNTGGARLSPQEIRNCSARTLGQVGEEFYRQIQECAKFEAFRVCTELLSEAERDRRGDEELVLRFFAAKNARDLFKGSVSDWLDAYMEGVLLKGTGFDAQKDPQIFRSLFSHLADVLGTAAFVRYREDKPVGGLTPAYYEAVTMGFLEGFPQVEKLSPDSVQAAIAATVQGAEFRSVTGPRANSREKLEKRIGLVRDALLEKLA